MIPVQQLLHQRSPLLSGHLEGRSPQGFSNLKASILLPNDKLPCSKEKRFVRRPLGQKVQFALNPVVKPQLWIFNILANLSKRCAEDNRTTPCQSPSSMRNQSFGRDLAESVSRQIFKCEHTCIWLPTYEYTYIHTSWFKCQSSCLDSTLHMNRTTDNQPTKVDILRPSNIADISSSDSVFAVLLDYVYVSLEYHSECVILCCHSCLSKEYREHPRVAPSASEFADLLKKLLALSVMFWGFWCKTKKQTHVIFGSSPKHKGPSSHGPKC